MSEEKQNIPEQDEEQAGLDTFFAERTEPIKEVKTGGMSKNVKGLIAGVAALVMLGGGLTTMLVLQKNDGGTDTDSTSATGDTQVAEELILNPNTKENVVSVEISNEDTFKVYRASEATDTEAAVYSIEGYEDVAVSASLLSTVVNNFSSLNATQLVEENCADLSAYGLDQPLSVVDMTYADGSVFHIAIGAESPIDATMSYCAVGQNVYLVDSSLANNYKMDALYFVSTTVLEEPAEDAYPIVNSLRVEREDWEYDVYLEYSYDEEEAEASGGTAATHVMYEPIFSYLNVEKSADVSNGMFGLIANDIIMAHPTDEDLAEAGINEPFCTVTMECDDGNTYKLHFGKTYVKNDEVYYHAYLEGNAVLYGIKQDYSIWPIMEPGDITSANIFGTYVWDIKTLEATANGKTLSFAGTGDSKDNFVVTKNGEACDTERFRLFYRFLLSIYGEELCFEEPLPEGEPEASVHIVTQDGKEDYTVSFYRVFNLTMLVAVDGMPTYKIRSSCLDAIEHNIDIFDDPNEEFTTTWR